MEVLKETAGLKGRVIAELWDARSGKKIGEFVSDNLVVNAGKAQVANLIAGGNTTSFNFIGVGSSSATPAVTDTDLVAPVTVNQCTQRLISSNTAAFRAFFSSAQALNGSLSECTLSTAQSAGTILSRALFSSQINKTSQKTLTLEWQISIG